MANLREKNKGELIKYAESLKLASRRAREKTAKAAEELTTVGVTSAAAFGMAFVDEKYGGETGLKAGPVPVPLVVAGAAYAIGLTGMAGQASPYVTAVGHGALAAFAAQAGAKAARRSA